MVLFAAFFAVSAFAAPRVTTKIVYFPVRGTTAGALYSDVLRKAPWGKSGRALATTQATISQNVEFYRASRCRLKRYRLELKIVTHLPRFAGRKPLSRSLRRTWKGFAGYVRRHEATHRSIYLRCARKIDTLARRISRKRGTCRQARGLLRGMFKDQLAKCEAIHVRYDRGEKARIRRLPLVVRALGPQRASKRPVRRRKRRARRR